MKTVATYRRPQESRLPLRSWLKRKIDSGEFAGLEWMDREKQMFRVPWKHASRQNWNIKDVGLFMGWAMYTGKFKEGKDKPDPKRWKTNFRCALNALPDIEHVPEEDSTRGQDAYRVYVMKPINKRRKRRSEAKLRKTEASKQVDIAVLTPPPSSESEQESDQEYLNEKEIIRLVDEMSEDSEPLDSPGMQQFSSSSNTNDDLLPFGLTEFLPLLYQPVPPADWYFHLETDKVRVERSVA